MPVFASLRGRCGMHAEALAHELQVDLEQVVGGPLHPPIPTLHPAAYRVRGRMHDAPSPTHTKY